MSYHRVMQFAYVSEVDGIVWWAGAIALGFTFRAVRGTTLVWPAIWAAAAWVFIGLSAKYSGPGQRYFSAVLAVTPVLAMLGAKRPQNIAWQCIVATMVVVLVSPVGKSVAYGELFFEAPLLFRWLLAAHILLGFANYALTRFAVPAAMAAVGQVLLGAGALPFVSEGSDRSFHNGVAVLACAIMLAVWLDRSSSKHAPGMQRLWNDFRNHYGAVWTLRVAERLNSTAEMHRWPVEFSWSGLLVKGFSPRSYFDDKSLQTLPSEAHQRVERELRSMLRRFVSHDWIVRRLETGDRRPES